MRPELCASARCPCAFSGDLRCASPVPLTSIRTTEDGIVRPQSCVVGEEDAGRVRNVAVRGSHVGLCVNAAAYRVIAAAL